MNSTHITLHRYQKVIMKKLVLNRSARFNELLITGLASEHMNYHLKKMIELGLVKKGAGRYVLTDIGKDYSNLMDDAMNCIEKLPKTSVVVRGVRRKSDSGEIEHLLNRRLREPYYGKVGHITGKVRFGETCTEAAARELMEETGLKAKNFWIEEVYRKMRHTADGVFVQDVIFFIILARDFEGTLIEKSEYQENFWMTAKVAQSRKDVDLYDDMVWHNNYVPRKLMLSENVAQVEEAF